MLSEVAGTPANNNGSATGVTNGVYAGETQGPTYDNLNRVSSEKTAGTTGSDCWGQSFTIDSLSNLTGMATILCSIGSLSGISTDGNNHLTNTPNTLTYDLAGNMTNDGANAYNYDAENRITSAAGVSYTYDGNGVRVQKSSGIIYWRSVTGDTLAESDGSGNMTSEYVYFAGRKIARRDGSGNVFYLYSDSLGSIHTITDSTGSPCYDASFTPYGQEVLNPSIANTCGISYKFTGYERDAETQLDYAYARYYDYRLGRFMSVDPLGGSVSDPQSLNEYGYVANDPMNQTDPSGAVNVSGFRDFGSGGLLGVEQELERMLSGGFGSGWSQFDTLNILFVAPVTEGYANIAPGFFPDYPDGYEGEVAVVALIGSAWDLINWKQLTGFRGGSSSNVCSINPALQAPSTSVDYTTNNATMEFTPEVVEALDDAISAMNSLGITPAFNSGYRDAAAQAQMVAGGAGPRPAAAVGSSPHQAGQAVDINGTATSQFSTISTIMQVFGFSTVANDPPHFQMVSGNRSEQLPNATMALL